MSDSPLHGGRPYGFCRRALVAAMTGLAASACISVGPQTIARDRVEYVEALRESWKRQVLLNIVSLRYGDAPIFLEVVSVINQYSLEGSLEAAANWGGLLDSTKTAGIGGRWTDRPTITYSPVSGERYVRSLLTPIPPASIIALVEAGWPIDFVLGLTVRSINGIASPSRSGFLGLHHRKSEFPAVVASLQRLQRVGAIGMRVAANGDALLTLRAPDDEEEAGALEATTKVLGLEPGRREFRIVFAPSPANGTEIAVLSRSILDILNELASAIDAPPEDVAAGRTNAMPNPEAAVEAVSVPYVRVQTSDSHPDGAFASVRYRDRWFFVEDGDISSKRTLSFLLILLSLSESGGGQSVPLVTVGAGG